MRLLLICIIVGGLSFITAIVGSIIEYNWRRCPAWVVTVNTVLWAIFIAALIGSLILGVVTANYAEVYSNTYERDGIQYALEHSADQSAEQKNILMVNGLVLLFLTVLMILIIYQLRRPLNDSILRNSFSTCAQPACVFH